MAGHEEPADAELMRELDERVWSFLTDKQRADVEALPLALVDLSDDELLAKGKDALKRHLRARTAIEAMDDDDEDLELVAAAFRSEILWRRICIAIGEEAERRRTGTSPRASRLN